ncbi:MAG TPA: hypothetical protein VGJ76_13225 [Pseudolabrys sp.]|jgi:hypothetical protein
MTDTQDRVLKLAKKLDGYLTGQKAEDVLGALAVMIASFVMTLSAEERYQMVDDFDATLREIIDDAEERRDPPRLVH